MSRRHKANFVSSHFQSMVNFHKKRLLRSAFEIREGCIVIIFKQGVD
jgi:hypothetical protein